MSGQHSFHYKTERLQVDDWHTFNLVDNTNHALNQIVQGIMTPAVTQSLPPPWQGHYSAARADQWISDRDNEGNTLLVQETESKQPIGLIILFSENQRDYRLGYMLRESAWGKGFASELIAGLVECCENSGVHSITGGVANDNPASSRVLVKNGFELSPESATADEQLYGLKFNDLNLT